MSKKKLRLVSWNVNGLRAAVKKDFFKYMDQLDADVLLLQETKLSKDQRTDEMILVDGYDSHWAYSRDKKGYSGVAAYTRPAPVAVAPGIGIEQFDSEGRILELDYEPEVLYWEF